MMDRKDIPQRKLAALTGISKTRLGLLLHSDPTKRSPMPVDVLQLILHALGPDIVAPYVRIQASGTLPQPLIELHDELGREHVRPPVTNAHIVCRLLLAKQKH